MAIKNLKISEKLYGKDWEKNGISRTYYNDVKAEFERVGKGSNGEFTTDDDRVVTFYYDHNYETVGIQSYSRNFASSDDKKEFESLLIKTLEAMLCPDELEEEKTNINIIKENVKKSVKESSKYSRDMEADKHLMTDEEFEDYYDLPKELAF